MARVYLRQYRWRAAARLQEEALRSARTGNREATVRYEIGLRLLDEGKYRDAAAEFEWSADLRRSLSGSPAAREASEHAMRVARTKAIAAETRLRP